MSKNRERQRTNRKLFKNIAMSHKNAFGNMDLTPYNMAKVMSTRNEKNIVYK